MYDELKLKKTTLTRALTAISGMDLTNVNYFKKLVKEQLGMEDNDLMRLNRVTKLNSLKKGGTMPIKVLVQNVEDRAALSEKYREQTIKRIVKEMKKENINNVESMIQFFDSDGDNLITRSELVEGFQRMNILLPETVITNVFQILDVTKDNEIDEDEMRAVFGKYLNEGGPVEVRDANELMEDIEGLDAEAAADIAKNLKNEVKKTQEYADFGLEAVSAEDLE